ncbi:MAG TPA: hypothetical protein VGP07_13480 [Polyangia bacterium]|jgi:hypothetical protein
MKTKSSPVRTALGFGGIAWTLVLVGCGPTFDPASLIETTRVLGARVQVGTETPARATPLPGETATVTWLVVAPTAPAPQGWAFALCTPGTPGELTCGSAPFAVYQGTDAEPVLSVAVPGADVLAGANSLLLYGRVCDGATPTFDPQSGYPGCANGGAGTTATATLLVGSADVTNHDPTADRGITLDGTDWPSAGSGDDPCVTGPRLVAGTEGHVIDVLTAGGDRESYTTSYGDPPVATLAREALQISPFATAGKFKNAYAFIDADDPADAPQAETKWDAPSVKETPIDRPVTFTFVVRDDRGGTDWTIRTACVGP